ncbi:unnamed protein product [Caenorhabditis sp. 36 PRJEB53466]|nr:unnamed protein product [Caenorhabditis sp. 36 PRJEB53466]
MSNEAKLKPNDIIKRSKNDYNWKVIVELGAGGFGTVNKVVQVNQNGVRINSKEFAMKTELKCISRQASRLKIEKNVMASYSKCDAQYRGHFPELIDIGQTATEKWIVMTLVGASLENLKRKRPFSPSTALQCSLQTLKAIHDFHQVGFLHRDIKPANCCIGAGENAEVVYLLDFGLARKYRMKNGVIRPPRPKTKMIGTPRYCPRASHRQEELSRKDDFESWLFMLFDFVDRENGVPWKGKPRDKAHEMKVRVFEEPNWISTVSSVPTKFIVMADYLNSLEYTSDVGFGILRETITDYARSLNLTLHERLDWTIPEDRDVTNTTTTTLTYSVDDNKSIGSEGSSDRERSQSRKSRSRVSKSKKPLKTRKSMMTFEEK